MLGVNSIAKRGVMQHYISVCRLSLAWVTCENSTSTSNADILSRSSSLDPILSPPVSGVQCWLPLSVVPHQLSAVQSPCRPVANCLVRVPVVNSLPAPLSSQLSFVSPYHFRIRRDFRSKNPLSGFAPKQTKESSALAGYPYSATRILMVGWVVGWLVGWLDFYGISTFVGYLTPNPFLCK